MTVLVAAVLVGGHIALSVGVARWARGDDPGWVEWWRYRRMVRGREKRYKERL
jgi:hypothetical protein